MSEDSDRDQAVGPDAQLQPSKGLESDLSHAHPAQTPTSLSCPPEVISLRMQWGSGCCWSLFTAEARMKEGMITVSLAPASPSGVVSWILPAQPHTPAPAKSPPSPPTPKLPAKPPVQGRGVLWLVPLWDGVSSVALGAGGTRAGLAGLPGIERAGQGQLSTLPTALAEG